MGRDPFGDSLVIAILERMSDACVFLDLQWRYVYVNQRAGALFGRRAEDLVGKHIWTEFPEGVGQPFHRAYEAAMADQQPRSIEAYYPPWDRWYENRIFPSPTGLAIFFSDVTERIQVMDALRRSEEWLLRATEAGRVGLWEWIVPTGEVRWSTGVEPLFGLSAGAFGGTIDDFLALVHPDDRAEVQAAIRGAVDSGDTYDVIHRISPSPGAVRWLCGRGHVTRDERGAAVRITGSVTDITELRQAEQDRTQALERVGHLEKMEVLGRLAAGVAHDFNNMLTVVRTGAEALARQYPEDPLVAHVIDASERAAALTGKLVDLARRRRAPLAEVDLNVVIDAMRPVLTGSVPPTVQVRTELDPQPALVFGDRGQLEQVVLNLALNARDAMPAGGTLTIRTRNLAEDVAVEVIDTGHGMEPEIAERIFEPFFTTKSGNGTGLGLTSVREIVTQHRGEVGVESAPGRGATFAVVLPRAGPPIRG